MSNQLWHGALMLAGANCLAGCRFANAERALLHAYAHVRRTNPTTDIYYNFARHSEHLAALRQDCKTTEETSPSRQLEHSPLRGSAGSRLNFGDEFSSPTCFVKANASPVQITSVCFWQRPTSHAFTNSAAVPYATAAAAPTFGLLCPQSTRADCASSSRPNGPAAHRHILLPPSPSPPQPSNRLSRSQPPAWPQPLLASRTLTTSPTIRPPSLLLASIPSPHPCRPPRQQLCQSSSVQPPPPLQQQQQPEEERPRGDVNGRVVPHGSLRDAASPPDSVYNIPNAVSAARLVSGPVIGWWLLQGHYEAAVWALAISGASDWLDGFLARRMGTASVFGSYLDPLADKVLIGCVAAALLANGHMPYWLAALVVGRDAVLVGGAFTMRLRSFGWRWPGRVAFFRTADDSSAPAAGGPHGASLVPREGGNKAAVAPGTDGIMAQGGGAGAGVAFMKPLLISKVNTVLQLLLLGNYLLRGMSGLPGEGVVVGLEVATAATTVMSLVAYSRQAAQGQLFK